MVGRNINGITLPHRRGPLDESTVGEHADYAVAAESFDDTIARRKVPKFGNDVGGCGHTQND